jgi:choline-sulfatase
MTTRRQLLAMAASAAFLKGVAPPRKNVLLLMTDQHRPHALGVDGDPLARTPNLDALARASVRFDQAYCTNPVCVPSRFSLMTGLYAHKGHVWGNANPWPADIKTIAHYFAAAGYATANIGKLHAVDNSAHGFEHLLEMRDWLDYLGPKARIWHEEMDRSGKDGRKGPVHVGRVSLLPEEDHFESWVARESIRYLRQRRDRPFFLVSSYIKPHDPFMPAERFARLFPPEKVELPETWGKLDLSTVPRRVQNAVRQSPHTPELLGPAQARIRIAMYYANLMQADDRMGTVLATLRELGLEQNTIVLYLSDHGDMVGDKGLWLKFQMYENSVGVPLMFHVPGITRGGSRCATVASLVRVLPTLAELCGLDVPSTLDGKSLVPNLKNPEERIDSAAYAEFGLGAGDGMQMIRHGDFKYVYNYKDIEQLYDLPRDPQGMTNLALLPGHKETARRLKQELFKIFDPSSGN